MSECAKLAEHFVKQAELKDEIAKKAEEEQKNQEETNRAGRDPTTTNPHTHDEGPDAKRQQVESPRGVLREPQDCEEEAPAKQRRTGEPAGEGGEAAEAMDVMAVASLPVNEEPPVPEGMTLEELGIGCVAVYTPQDAGAALCARGHFCCPSPLYGGGLVLRKRL